PDVTAWNGSDPLDLAYANASFIGEDASDEAGGSVAGAGDVNGDGFADILIGAPKHDDEGNRAGQTYLVLGRPDVTAWNGSDPLDLAYANASFIGEDEDDFSGQSVAGAGDVNSDGFADILIGASADEEGGSAAGQTYLVLGEPLPGRLGVSVQSVYADDITIEITFLSKDHLGNELADVQMWVSNGTVEWTGTTNQSGQFKVTLDYTPVEFNLEVQASKYPYTKDFTTISIYVDPEAVKIEPISEFTGLLLAVAGVMGLTIVGSWLALSRKWKSRDKG
ncbi:MAG: integrin alpha, partial [Candidatus Hodarchaeota archaeon]